MIAVFLVAVLVAVSSAADPSEDINWIDYRLAPPKYDDDQSTTVTPTSTPPPPPQICTKPGFVCGGCDKVFFCTFSNGQWNQVLIEDCFASGTTCNDGQCSDTPTGDCDDREFECSSIEGVYPDPLLCTKYHYCVPDSPRPLKLFSSNCGKGYWYNARTTYCDKKLANDTCTGYPVPICKSLGQTAPLTENPSIYYVCLPYKPQGDTRLFPFLHLCENGKVSDGKYGCKDK